jgi:hypothetical protein
MSDNLEDVIATHGPTEIEDTATGGGIVYLLTVSENQAFARGNGPDEGNVMLFTATGSTSLAGSKGFGVGKAKAPSRMIDTVDIGVVEIW